MCRLDPLIRLNANSSGQTKCVIFVDDIIKARKQLQNFSSTIVASYPFINGFGANINVHKVDDLCALKCVKAISSHSYATTLMQHAKQQLNVENAYLALGYGEGISIAIIDTGICSHMDFLVPTNRCKFIDFVGSHDECYDDNGHGTAVASIACGNGLLSGTKFSGIAPKSNIISLKAVNSLGEGSVFAILNAMQWIFDNAQKYNIKVVCMSFGANPIVGGIDPLSEGASVLWKSGIVVVASAGNSGPNYNTIMSPGINPNIITVGGAEFNGDKVSVAPFSSRGEKGMGIKPDLVTHSVDIVACSAKGKYAKFTGTSMSAPIVAGVAGLILSKRPDFTPDKVKELLMENTTKLSDEKEFVGSGLLNIDFVNDL